MIARQHLLLLQAGSTSEVLTACAGTKFLLPFVDTPPRMRPVEPIQNFLRGEGLSATLRSVCLGYERDAALHRLAILDVDGRDRRASWNWIPLSALLEGRLALGPQAHLLVSYARHCGRGRCPSVLSRQLIEEVRRLVVEELAFTSSRNPPRVIVRSALPERGVLEVSADGNTCFVYCVPARRECHETTLTRLLPAVCPRYFPKRLACWPDRGLLVQARAPGRPVPPMPDIQTASLVGAALADIAMSMRNSEAQTAVRASCLHAAAGTMSETFRSAFERSPARGMENEMALRTLGRLWQKLPRTLAETWLHTDLAPQNVYRDGDRLTFIDLERPAWGPALLAPAIAHISLWPASGFPIPPEPAAMWMAWLEALKDGMRASDLDRIAKPACQIARLLRLQWSLIACDLKERSGEMLETSSIRVRLIAAIRQLLQPSKSD